MADLAIQAAELNPGMPGIATFTAAMLCEVGRSDEARELLEPFVADHFSYVIDSRRGGSLVSLAYAASVVARMGWTEAARDLLITLTPFASQIPVAVGTTTGCQVGYYLGLLSASLGQDVEAGARFADALESNTRIGAAWGCAATQLAWGEMLMSRSRRREDRARAVSMLETARESAARHGYGTIERRSIDLLSRQ
jgi:hypothetical protein